MDKVYYVYIHYRGDTGQPFYVGKGSGSRANSKWSRNRRWTFIAEKHGFSVKVISSGMSEHCANTLERIVISAMRASHIDLCNVSDGGDGCRHSSPSKRKKVNCSNGMIFHSVNEAASWAGCSATKISSVCNGRRMTAGGYSWWLHGEKPKEYVSPSSRMGHKKAVSRSDGVNFDSVKEAAESVCAATGANISACLSGRIKKAYGYTWSYA